MALEVTLTIPDALYRQAVRLGAVRGKPVEEVLVEAIDFSEYMAASTDDNLDLTEQNLVLAREQAAFLAMFSDLQMQYPGQYVAVYNGELVGNDADFGVLYERVLAAYPDETVWISKVGTEPIATISFRSPRMFVG